MIIGIDIDDTISDTYSYVFTYAQKYTIEDLKKDIKNSNKDCTTHMYVSTFHNWNKQEEIQFFDKYYKLIVENVKPKIFAKETIDKLKEEGHKIYLITARFLSKKFNIEEATKKWLKENEIYYDKLIINAEDKVKFSKDHNVDIFIDDSIKNCEEMANANIKTYMMNTIVNVNYRNDKIKRIYSWQHLYQEITKFKEEIK